MQKELPWLQLGRSVGFRQVNVCWAELLQVSCRKAVNPGMVSAHLRQTMGLESPKASGKLKLK